MWSVAWAIPFKTMRANWTTLVWHIDATELIYKGFNFFCKMIFPPHFWRGAHPSPPQKNFLPGGKVGAVITCHLRFKSADFYKF